MLACTADKCCGVRGAYDDALAEFARAERRYVAVRPATVAAGLAFAERGEVLRIRGDFDAAAAAYTQAAALGHDPQPGLSLFWLAQGRTEPALAAVRRMLAETHDPVAPVRSAPRRRRDSRRGRAVGRGWHGCRGAGRARHGVRLDCSSPRWRGTPRAPFSSAGVIPGRRRGRFARPCQLWSASIARTRCSRACGARSGPPRAGRQGVGPREFDAARTVFAELGAEPAAREVDRLWCARRRADSPTGRSRCSASSRGQEQRRNRRLALPQPQDGCSPSQQHLHQTRRSPRTAAARTPIDTG